MPLTTGTTAPSFTLKSKTAGSLADVAIPTAGKPTVLLFFPLAFTSVCTTEMCDVSQGLADYTGLGAEVIGISVDSPFAQEAWAKQSGITIPLASDLNKEVTNAYGVLFKGIGGGIGDSAARAAFVIDKSGVIQYAEQTPTPKDLPNFDAIKATLAGLQ
jgi:glutaredoxin-dependent peroxiredoxin